MILIEKGPAPAELDEANETLTKANLEIYDEHGTDTRISSSKKNAKKLADDTIYITAAYRAGAVKARLVQSHFAKCAYCETRILAISHGDVEHFRPKSEYTDGDEKGMGYFWLAYDWVNLYLGCQVRNETYKGTYFPMMPAVEGLIDASVRLEPGDDLDDDGEENAVLIDPGRENPRALVSFDPDAGTMAARAGGNFVVNASRVGKNVILLGLNRPDLVAARHRHACFLRSMFVLMAHGAPADTGIQDVLQGVCDGIAALAATPDFDAALDLQKKLAAECAKVYEGKGTGPGGENAWAALRWLCFSVTPLAEYSGLAQDCVAAWTEELKQALKPVQSQGITMHPSTPSAQSYTSSSNVLGWPPVRLQEVPAHVASLVRAVNAYVEQKAGELDNLREAVREELYDELNDLVAAFNRFQQAFDARKAEGAYMVWQVELTVLGESLDEIGAKACAGKRAKLLAFLNQEAAGAESARCSALDPRLRQVWSDFQILYGRAPAAAAVWKKARETVRLGAEISQLLGVVLKHAQQQTDPDPQFPGDFQIDAMAVFWSDSGTLLAKLPAPFAGNVAGIAEGYRSWVNTALTPYQRRWAIHWAAKQGVKAKREELAGTWPSRDELAGLGKFLGAAGDLLGRCRQLIQEYRDAGMTSGSWRSNTCYSMHNFLVDVEDACEKDLPELYDSAQPVVEPRPTQDDPWHAKPVVYKLRAHKQLTWAVSTAKKKLADFHAARAKLKTKRKLTVKQQATLDGLVKEDTRVRSLIAKVHALREAQRISADS